MSNGFTVGLEDVLAAGGGPRPVMHVAGDLYEMTEAAWAHLGAWRSDTDYRRFLARYGTSIVGLEDVDGGLVTVPWTRARAINVLARAIAWVRGSDDKPRPAFPPKDLADNLLVTPNPPLPALERIVEVPILGADGAVRTDPGYDPVTRCFLQPAPGLAVDPVASRPTAGDVKCARGLFAELVADFPFKGHGAADDGACERTHAYAALLAPFVRALIEGPTPLHLIEAPSPGSGKTLLAMAVASPALGGRSLPAMTEAAGDEWRKRITAKLRLAPTYVLLDNLRNVLDSSSLASALTSATFEDRVLGASEMVHLPVRCTWLATANNPALSDEMTRRAVRTRLDAGVEFPEERNGFRHPHLLAWARENRGGLVWSALTLARDWLTAGKPDPAPAARLGGFEAWTHVVGGILEHADLGSVLGNADELRSVNRESGPGAFLAAAWLRFGPGEWTSSAAIELAREHLDLGAGADAQLAHALGNRLRLIVDRPFGGFVLRRPGRTQTNTARWTLEQVAGEGAS